MKSFMASPATIERKWYVVDAAGQTLGRLSSEIAKVLRGKHKPIFTPHMDTGDYVIVVNADKIKVTGRKMEQKMYFRHSDYPGGVKERRWCGNMKSWCTPYAGRWCTIITSRRTSCRRLSSRHGCMRTTARRRHTGRGCAASR